MTQLGDQHRERKKQIDPYVQVMTFNRQVSSLSHPSPYLVRINEERNPLALLPISRAYNENLDQKQKWETIIQRFNLNKIPILMHCQIILSVNVTVINVNLAFKVA